MDGWVVRCVCVGVRPPGQHQGPRLQDGASVTLNGYVCVCVWRGGGEIGRVCVLVHSHPGSIRAHACRMEH